MRQIVPVRIDGPERSPFSYLKPSQIKKALFPKFTVTFLPPRRLVLDPALKGKLRRQAAGLALQDIMVEAAVATTPIDRTLFEALADAHKTRDIGRPAVADPLGIELSYRKLILAAQVLGPKLAPYAAPGGAVGVMLPNSVGVAITFFALQAIGRVPAMINFTAGAPNIKASCRAADVSVILTSRTFVQRGRLQSLVGHLEQSVRIVYLEDVRLGIGVRDKLMGFLAGTQGARGPPGQRSRRHSLHLGLGRHTQGRGAVASQRARQLRAVPRAHRRQRPGPGVQRAARVPFVRIDGRADHAAGRRRADVPLSFAGALPHRARADLRQRRHHHVRHQYVPRGLRARRAPLRSAQRAPGDRRRGGGEG